MYRHKPYISTLSTLLTAGTLAIGACQPDQEKQGSVSQENLLDGSNITIVVVPSEADKALEKARAECNVQYKSCFSIAEGIEDDAKKAYKLTVKKCQPVGSANSACKAAALDSYAQKAPTWTSKVGECRENFKNCP